MMTFSHYIYIYLYQTCTCFHYDQYTTYSRFQTARTSERKKTITANVLNAKIKSKSRTGTKRCVYRTEKVKKATSCGVIGASKGTWTNGRPLWLSHSEPMQLDGGLGDTLVREECRYLGSLVTLKLYDFTHLVVINESSITGKFLGTSSSRSQWKIVSNGWYLLECL